MENGKSKLPGFGGSKGNKNKKSEKIAKSILGLALAAVLIVAVNKSSSNVNLGKDSEISFSQVIEMVDKGEIKEIKEEGQKLIITKQNEDKPTNFAVLPFGASATEQGLDVSKVNYKAKQLDDGSINWAEVLINVGLPFLLLVGLFAFIAKQAQGQGNQALNFGRSKAKIYNGEKSKTGFKEVAGNKEAKQDLEEVVDFLKNPKKFTDIGAKVPKGVLLVGPPGTGKTMLARAVAGEAGVPFFSISGSEFVEMFVGVGASRVRDLFLKAKKNSPCIIFIDEIDAVGRRRGSGMGGGHDEREQTLNQILVEMDGFEAGENVIVLAATNRADVLDPALLRPGRFDRRVNIPLPDRLDREEILNVHFAKKPLAESVRVKDLSKKTTGMSGADLANLANESAIIAARRKSKVIDNSDVVEAFERVAIGPERKNKIMTEQDRIMTAYHEGGHALVGHVLPNSGGLHKVTIIPRGGTGGVTWFLDEEDKIYYSINEYKDVLARIVAGRVAEDVIYGRNWVTTGAGNDLQKASALAREMIIEQGMGEKLRNQVFHEDEGSMMFDRMVHSKSYSENTAQQIDNEIKALIEEAVERARKIIIVNKTELEKLKDALLEKETLDEEEARFVLKDAKCPKELILN
jgi:cell division protease FtsH